MKCNKLQSSLIFWEVTKDFIYHYLPDIRRVSPNTIASYKDSLNIYIDYLEQKKNQNRKKISFENFDRTSLKEYIDWLLNTRKLAERTCNLRLTAIRSLLEYASNEYIEIMSVYLSACSVKGVKVPDIPIEFFEHEQIQALLAAPNTLKKIGRRNQMMLILLYDTAARVSELLELTIKSLHLDSNIPYITLLGKGKKYRNIPLMKKTLEHLKRYLNEFHHGTNQTESLFYAVTYGQKHHLSNDTMEKMIKKYAKECTLSGVTMPDSSHCHLIRKTRAMDLYQSGVPLTHIQQLLGHKDLSTTSGFYAFATLDTLVKSIETVNGVGFAENRKWNDKDILAKIYRL